MRKLIYTTLFALAAVTGAQALTTVTDKDQVITVTNSALYDSGTFAPSAPMKSQDRMAQADTAKTTTVQTSAPVTSTTVVKGGDWAASVLAWLQVAFVTTIGAVGTALLYKVLGWLGVQVTDQQKAQLQGVIVNGLNAAGNKAQAQLRANPNLDINVQSQIIADTVSYAQSHAADTIKALGLDPNSGQAVEAIKARIQTAINDPKSPTPPLMTPTTGGGVAQPLAPGA